jgi:hypothetical protein
MAEFFGFEIRKKTPNERNLDDFAAKQEDDGALIVAAGGVYGTVIDLEGAAKTEADLVTKYREISLHPEVESAIDDIINEAIVSEAEETVKLDLDKINTVSDNVKKIIETEFDEVLKLLDFNNQSYEIFKRWYTDGRLYYHAIIDKDNPRDGIQEVRYIDPRKIKKIRETKRKKVGDNYNTTALKAEAEYFIYNERGFNLQPATGPMNTNYAGLKIAKDSIVHCTSGLLDKSNSLVLGYLHKAIKPLNQLRSLEDSVVIYRISRAPERRIFYIDVGNLPKMKAEQYLRDMMIRHKNRIVYDASTGEIRDDRKFMTMLEDYWLPRREGNRGTEISTLPGGQNLGEMTDVEYFQKVLYKSLNVPIGRMESEASFNMGRATEISRDEVKFAKFINRLRNRFNHLFLKLLEKQLLLKGIIAKDDWPDISNNIKVVYARDNFFAELKDIEILKERSVAIQSMTDVGIIGKYYSHDWVRKHILQQSNEDIEMMDEQIQVELRNPILNPPVEEEPAQPN